MYQGSHQSLRCRCGAASALLNHPKPIKAFPSKQAFLQKTGAPCSSSPHCWRAQQCHCVQIMVGIPAHCSTQLPPKALAAHWTSHPLAQETEHFTASSETSATSRSDVNWQELMTGGHQSTYWQFTWTPAHLCTLSVNPTVIWATAVRFWPERLSPGFPGCVIRITAQKLGGLRLHKKKDTCWNKRKWGSQQLLHRENPHQTPSPLQCSPGMPKMPSRGWRGRRSARQTARQSARSSKILESS